VKETKQRTRTQNLKRIIELVGLISVAVHKGKKVAAYNMLCQITEAVDQLSKDDAKGRPA